jgi:phenylalanyl-tRNA synthetase beta chain
MILSWNWLTEYLRLDMPVDVLAERLTLAGLNRESIEDVEGDIAIDLEITSNRPDCLGHLGVAREIAVLFSKELLIPDPEPPTTGVPVQERTGVTVLADDLCPRFTARIVSGVSIGESPWWMRKRLETIGVRPISNIVDVTNYVMFECGQPLHAYDLDRLDGHRLVVRRALEGERLTAINNREYELSPGMLVIADASHPVGLGGVMGGLETEIGYDTTNVLIEAAQFDAMSVRRTSRALGLFSPSSFRFERPLDPEMTEWASRRCAELVLEVAGGTLHPGVIDVGPLPPKRLPIRLRLAQIERTLGITIDRERVWSILRTLGLEWIGDDERSIHVIPPSWRSDLEREIDLIEEVARIHGYEHIPEDASIGMAAARRDARERVEATVRDVLCGCGFDETVTFSLVDDRFATALAPGPALPPLRVEHSSRKRESALRQSLVPSLLAVRLHNESHGQFDADLFEIANVYVPREGHDLPDERTRLALVAGRGFHEQKGVVELLLERLHVETGLRARPVDLALFAQGRSAELLLDEVHLGYLGELDQAELQAYELREGCAAAELELDVLLAHAHLVASHHPLPPFPAVIRDLSLVVSRNLPWSELSATVSQAAGPTLERMQYLDTFRGGNLPNDKESVHFSMVFRHRDRTLTGEEVERAVKSVVDACESRFGAKLRG